MHNRVRYDHSRPSHDLAMSMRKCIWIGNHIKQLKEQFKQSDGSLCAIELSHIDTSKHWYFTLNCFIEDQPNLTIEQVLKTIEEINRKPIKIVQTAFDNVYKNRHEWYGNDNKKLFYAPINYDVINNSKILYLILIW